MTLANRFMIVVLVGSVLSCGGGEKPAATSTAPAPSAAGTPTTAAPAAAPAAPATGPAALGAPMPGYAATLLDGSSFQLSAEKGNVVFLNLWATWCGPCRYEIPELQKMHDRYASRGFKVVGVSVDEGNPDEVRKFVADRKMTYPVALDPEGRLAVVLDASVLPTSALVDRDGKMVWKKIGIVSTTDEDLVKALEKALGE